MIGKNNFYEKEKFLTNQKPVYGLKKLSIGVASVLLGTAFFFSGGNSAHAATTVSETLTAANELSPAASDSTHTLQVQSTVPDSVTSAATTPAVATNASAAVSQASTTSVAPAVSAVATQPTRPTSGNSATILTSTLAATVSSVDSTASLATSFLVTSASAASSSQALHAETTKKRVVRAVAAIDPVAGRVSADGLVAMNPNFGASLQISKNTIGNDQTNSGLSVILSGAVSAGDVYTIMVPYEHFTNIDDSQFKAIQDGTTQISTEKRDGITYRVYQLTFNSSYLIDKNGYRLTIAKRGNGYYYGDNNFPLNIADGDTPRTIEWTYANPTDGIAPVAGPSLHYTEKLRTGFDNPTFTQARPNPNSIAKLLPDTDYTFELRLNQVLGESDTGSGSAQINVTRNYGAQIRIPVPQGFVLNHDLTMQETMLRDGDQTTITQAGPGQDIIITVPKGSGSQNYNDGRTTSPYRIVGHFAVPQLDQTETLTATSPIEVTEQILTTTGYQTLTKTFDKPWSVQILGTADPAKGKLGLSILGNNDKNQFVQTQATKIVNYFGFRNDTVNQFNNNLHLLAEVPMGLAVTGVGLPQLNNVDRPNTTQYTYLITLTDGTVLEGTAAAGADVTVPTGKFIAKVELIPDQWAPGATTTMPYIVNNLGDKQKPGLDAFRLYGTLSAALNHQDPLPADTKLTTKFSIYSPLLTDSAGKLVTYIAANDQTVIGADAVKSDLNSFGWQSSNRYFRDTVNGLKLYGDGYGYLSVNQANGTIETANIYEPIFYFVLPNGFSFLGDWSNFENKNADAHGVIGTPQVTKYVVDGRQVVKIDYSGTGFAYNARSGGVSNTFPIAIDPDAIPGTYGYQAYMFTKTGMRDANKLVAHPDAAVKQFTQGITDSGRDGKLYQIGQGNFTILTPPTAFIPNTAQGNQDQKAGQLGNSDIWGDEHLNYFVRVANYSDQGLGNGYLVTNLPQTSATSFTFHLTGPVTFEPHGTSFTTSDFVIKYSTQLQTLPTSGQKGYLPSEDGFVTADQVKDWSQIKAVMIHFLKQLPPKTSVGQFTLTGTALDFKNEAQKTGYLNSVMMATDLNPFVSTKAGIRLTGQATLKARLHYVDAQGHDQYIAVPNLTKTYTINQDTLAVADFSAAQIPADLIPANYELSPAQPTLVATGSEAGADAAAFGQVVRYYFNGDTVQFELVHQQQVVTKTYVRTINYEYDPSAPIYQAGGKNQVAEPVTQSYQVTMTTDLVTGQTTYQIVPVAGGSTQTTPSFTIAGHSAPSKAGYTANPTEAANAAAAWQIDIAQSFAQHAEDTITETQTVHYTADQQHLYFTVIDDTTKTVLAKDVQIGTGVTDGKVDDENKTVFWDLNDRLYQAEQDGYSLSSTHYFDTDYQKFTDADGYVAMPLKYSSIAANNHITVHLVHDLNFTKETHTVTRTINFRDADADKLINEANPKLSATTYPQTITQTVQFVRYAVYDRVNGTLVGYYQPGQVDVIDDGTVIMPKEGQNYTPVTAENVKTAGYEAVASDQWAAQDTYDLRQYGYQAAEDNHGQPYAQVAAQTVTPTTADQAITVFYHQQWVTVTVDNPPTAGQVVPNQPGKPTYPDNDFAKHLADYQSTSTRTIVYKYAPRTFVNGQDVGGQVVPRLRSIRQTVRFVRNVEINLVTGELSVRNTWTPVEATTEDQTGQQTTITSGAGVGDFASVASPAYDRQTPDQYPDLLGYTPQESLAPSHAATQGQNDGDVTVYYASNASRAQISFIDQDTGDTLHVDGLTGQTGERLNYDPTSVIATLQKQGYKLVDNGWVQNPAGLNQATFDAYAPGETVDTQDWKIPVIVKQVWQLIFCHKRLTIPATDPQTPTEQITAGDGYTHAYPSGVAEADLNRTVHRQIYFKYEDGSDAFNSVDQAVDYTRTATIDLVKLAKGEADAVTYTKWVADQQQTRFPEYSLLDNDHLLPGYTATLAGAPATIVPSERIAFDQSGLPANGNDVTILYTANPQTTRITFIDNQTGKIVSPIYPLSGKTGQTLTLKDGDTYKDPKGNLITVPAGWKLIPGEKIPETVTFTGAATPDIQVRVEHAMVTVSPDDPKTPADAMPDNPAKKFPAGVAASDLNKTITRTIILHLPDQTTKTIKQQVTFQRKAIVDEVSGAIDYQAWTVKKDDSADFASVAASDFADQLTEAQRAGLVGYTPTLPAPALKVQQSDQDSTFDISYTANPQKAGLILVDDDAQGAQLKALTANGKFGQAIDFSQKGQSLADLIAVLARQHYLVNSTATDNFDYQTGANYQADDAKNQFVIHFVHEKIPTQRTATITRTVHYQYENGQLADEDQVAQQVVTQTGEKDLVTNQEHYAQKWWANVKFEAGRLPSHVGYTAKIDDQVVTEVPADQVTITGADFKDQAVETTVVYHANEQHAQLVIIDDDASEASQRTLQTLTTTGKYATAIDFTADGQSLAAILTSWQQRGYTVKSNSFTAGTTYQVDDKQNQFVVHLGHKLIPVMPDQPKTPADALPDNPEQTFPQGVGSTDLNKTVKRVILVHQPDGQITRIDQAVHFTRTATVDEATGQVVSYTDWQADGSTTLAAYAAPTFSGYTADQAVAEQVVTPTSTDSQVDIYYTANAHTTPIEYVDDDNGGAVVKTGELTGRTGDTVTTNVTNPDPTKYEVVPGTPEKITFGPDGYGKVTVHLKHKTQATSRTKTVTQKITYHLPDGTTKVTTRTLTFTQGGTTDLATGATTWDANWTQTDHFTGLPSPNYPGYTPSQIEASASSVTVDHTTWDADLDQALDVTYTADTHTTPIEYVDDDANGHVVKTGELTRRTGETVATHVTNPDSNKYEVVPGAPTEITFGPDGHAKVTVHLKHKTQATSRTKTVTQTITYHLPDGTTKVVPRTLTFTQGGTLDLATGATTWDANWTQTDSFTGLISPSYPGYTPSQAEAGASTVTVDHTTWDADLDQVLDVTYTADAHTTPIEYVDDDNGGAVVKTGELTGRTGDTVATNVTNPDPNKYEVVPGAPTEITFGPDGHGKVTVHLKHKTQATSRPKTVTQTITYHLPDGTTKVTTRTLTFTQGGTTDLATGETTWDANWTQTDHFTGLVSPSYPGYTPSQAEAGASTVTVNDANWATDLDQTLDITYTANSHTTPIEYVDDDANGHVVKTGTITGQTGETVATHVTNPDPNKYEVVPGTPEEITFGPDGHGKVTVHLKHKTQATSRTKTVTQTITYHLPDGTTKVTTRTLTFTQGGTTDLATGATTWDANWTQTQTLAAVASPIYNGYTASAAMAGATQITVTTPTWTTNLDQQIDVYYTPTTTQIPIYYYDENGHPIADPIIVDGNGATNFDEYHKVITGYQFERREIKGADGRLTEVIFYYLKTTNGGEITPPVQPVQPVGPSQPAQPTAPSQPTPTSSGQGTPTAEQELPQTGNQTSETSVLGLTLLGVLGLLGLSKRKRKE